MVDKATASARAGARRPGLEIVYYDARTGEEGALGVVDDYGQAQLFISGG